MKSIFFFLLFIYFSVNATGQSTPSFPKINYKIIKFKKQAELTKFLKNFNLKRNKTNYRVITTLNRKELRFFRVNQPIIVPDTFISDLRAYSVFPNFYDSAKEISKLIVVSNIYQAYACYEFGNLIHFAAISSGKKSTPTYPGRYALQWRERLRRSSFNEEWIMPFTWNFHRITGMAFHQFEMPGYPASHMCIRQFKEDAEWLFHWGEGPKRDSNGKIIPMSGTPVLIIDFYDFKSKSKKWLQLTSNKDTIDYLPSNPMEFEEALIPIIHVPPELRGMLSKTERKRYESALDTLIKRNILPSDIRLTPSQSIKKKPNSQKGSKTTKD